MFDEGCGMGLLGGKVTDEHMQGIPPVTGRDRGHDGSGGGVVVLVVGGALQDGASCL